MPFCEVIYRRNIKAYRDKLGPAFDSIKHTDVAKTLSDTNAIANSILRFPSRGLAYGGVITGGLAGNQLGGGADCGCQ